MRTRPFYGRGVAFPFRRNPATGGVQVTDGLSDEATVDLAYLREDWTIQENIEGPENHIAESIAHILLTRPLEHDTLPPFGSLPFNILFEHNHPAFWALAANYFAHGTDPWEKRATIPPEGVEWTATALGIERGELPVKVTPKFIQTQVSGNLVAPFVSPRQARDYTYPINELDDSRHDYPSRYFGINTFDHDGIHYDRFPRREPIPPAYDDEFYTTQYGDSWLLISWNLYGDIRYWPYIARMYGDDAAEDGLTRQSLDPANDPEIGTVLRVPSRTRMLTELSGVHHA